jgi:hypothetical protein
MYTVPASGIMITSPGRTGREKATSDTSALMSRMLKTMGSTFRSSASLLVAPGPLGATSAPSSDASLAACGMKTTVRDASADGPRAIVIMSKMVSVCVAGS